MTKIHPILSLNGKLYMVGKPVLDGGTLRVTDSHVIRNGGQTVQYREILASNDPSLSSLPKLPAVKNNIEQLANDFFNNEILEKKYYTSSRDIKIGFEGGYKAKGEEKLYSEEDIATAITLCLSGTWTSAKIAYDFIIKSLNKHSIPTAIEVEMEQFQSTNTTLTEVYGDFRPKTDENNQIIGRYIWT